MKNSGKIASAALAAAVSAASWGCELVEVEAAPPDDVVVAEAVVLLVADSGGGSGFSMSVSALLHRTRRDAAADPVDGATVRVAGQDGRTVMLLPAPRVERCGLDSLNWDWARDMYGASCYRAAESEPLFAPGDKLALEVVLAGGGVLKGASQIPSPFAMPDLRLAGGVCGMRPETHQRIDWTEAGGAWAYKNEAQITGYDPGKGTGYRPDSLHLELLAIGRDETGLVFPRAFGLAEYVEGTYDRELITRLRSGLPDGASAALSVTAIDRNWMNWTRNSGITFSGVVRTPSVFGDGTGAFATGVQRRFEVTVGGDTGAPACGPEEPVGSAAPA